MKPYTFKSCEVTIGGVKVAGFGPGDSICVHTPRNYRDQRVTRFRRWKGRHGDRCARGCYRALQRSMLADFERTRKMSGPTRPSWLKPWVERELGYEVADAWIVDGQVSVQTLGKIENVAVTVEFKG